MTSRIRLAVTPRARSHIEDILQYTAETWGLDQQDAYEQVLYAAFDRIRAFPDIGHPVSGHPANIREYHLQHHVIYYRREPEAVDILRIVSSRRRRR